MTNTGRNGGNAIAAIRDLMARGGVTQAELAVTAGVSQSQLSKMLRGVRPVTIDQLEAMAEAFGYEMVDLLNGTSFDAPTGNERAADVSEAVRFFNDVADGFANEYVVGPAEAETFEQDRAAAFRAFGIDPEEYR